MPSVQPLDHPTMRFPAWMYGRVFVASLAWRDMSLIVLAPDHFSCRSVIKCRIQTQMLRLLQARLGSYGYVIAQQRTQHRPVIDIGGGHDDRKRHAASVTQNMVFNPRFGAICRIWTAFFSPPAASAHRCRHRLAIASQCRGVGRRDRGSVARCLQRRQPVPIQPDGHKPFDEARTLWAWRATAHPSRECRASRQGVGDQRRVCDLHDSVVVAVAELRFRSPPTDHQVLFWVLA